MKRQGEKAEIPEIYRCCKRLKFCDGKHTKETLATPEVIIPYGRIVLLSCCIQDVDLHLLPIQDNFLPVAVSFGGLVVFNKLCEKRKISTNLIFEECHFWLIPGQYLVQPVYSAIKEGLLLSTLARLNEPAQSSSSLFLIVSALFCILQFPNFYIHGIVCLGWFPVAMTITKPRLSYNPYQRQYGSQAALGLPGWNRGIWGKPPNATKCKYSPHHTWTGVLGLIYQLLHCPP